MCTRDSAYVILNSYSLCISEEFYIFSAIFRLLVLFFSLIYHSVIMTYFVLFMNLVQVLNEKQQKCVIHGESVEKIPASFSFRSIIIIKSEL